MNFPQEEKASFKTNEHPSESNKSFIENDNSKGPCDDENARLIMIDECGRLGNHLSEYAGVLALAKLTGAEPVVTVVRKLP